MAELNLASLETGALSLGSNKLCRARHGLFLYPAGDALIGRSLELYGEFAEGENRVMARLTQPGDTVVDVGANLGTVTLPLARRVGPEGRVYSFEPQRQVFQCLCATLALNGIGNVQAWPLAVGAEPGVARIAPPASANLGAARLVNDGQGETVRVVTLDSLQLQACALIKVDVEGMEYDVLRGSADTIGRARPAIYAEAKKGAGTTKVIAWLQERDYDLYWHFAAFFSAENFRRRKDNLFVGSDGKTGINMGDINLLAIPRERDLKSDLPKIVGPDADWVADYAAWQEARKAKT